MKLLRLVLLLLLTGTVVPAQERPETAAPLVIAHVTVVDVRNGSLLRNRTVVVEGGRITRIEASGRARPVKGAQVIEARGKYLIPGLWDMHVHLYDSKARAFPMLLANGVTGVRSTGAHVDDIPTLAGWREQAKRDRAPVPRIVFAGPVLDGPKPIWPGSIAVANPEDGRRAVRELKERGVDFIKVYDGLSRESYFAIAEEAKRLRIPFVGHVPPSITAAEASDAGQRSIEHLEGILHYSILRTTLEPFSDADAKALFARFAKNGTWQVPTLITGRTFAFLDEDATARDPRLKYMSADWRKNWEGRREFFRKGHTPEQWSFRRMILEKNKALVSELRKAGVPLLAGTDAGGVPYVYYGFSLHDELELLVASGLTPLDALQAATLNPARFLGLEKEMGTVEPSREADLVALYSNPLTDIGNTRKIHAVVVHGRYFTRPELDRWLAQVETAAKTQ